MQSTYLLPKVRGMYSIRLREICINIRHCLTVSLSTRIALILADIIVLVVTWIRAIGVVREASRIKVRVPLGQVLIRDGE